MILSCFQVDGCCVFVMTEQTLYFKQICLHEKFSTTLHLKNIGSVIAPISVKVEDFGRSVFFLSESNMLIQPYTEGTVQVTFSPHSLEVSRCWYYNYFFLDLLSHIQLFK